MPDDPTPERLLASEVLARAEDEWSRPADLADAEWERCRNSTLAEWQTAALLACFPDARYVAIDRETGEVVAFEQYGRGWWRNAFTGELSELNADDDPDEGDPLFTLARPLPAAPEGDPER